MRADCLSIKMFLERRMKLFARFIRRQRGSNPNTVFARQRFGKTMPGETGALAGARFGFLVN